MLANRELYSIRGRLFKYLAADASPQADQSVEVFVTVERTTLRSEVAGKAMSSITPEAVTVEPNPGTSKSTSCRHTLLKKLGVVFSILRCTLSHVSFGLKMRNRALTLRRRLPFTLPP